MKFVTTTHCLSRFYRLICVFSKKDTKRLSYRKKLHNTLRGTGLLIALVLSAQSGAAVINLPAFNVDIHQTSVSGLSSGGFMAVQFEVAYSSILKGAGIIAGGPYFCAQGNLTTALQPCMAANGSTNVSKLITITDENASGQKIDPTSNLAHHKIWMFSGKVDSTVKQPVMDDLQTYYLHYVSEANISYKRDIAAEHAMPTDFYGNTCATKGDPFINNCHYDAAGELLKWIYGNNLNPGNTGTLSDDHFIEFDQGEFIPNPNSHSLANTGWLYVPANCANGQVCKLHVVFHGCKQYPSYSYFALGMGMVNYGITYVKNTGYNAWADTNNLIVLYPQAFNGKENPNGCWDWWGYDDPNYAAKNGNQMKAVKAMVDRIASGFIPLEAPTGLNVTDRTEHALSLSWDAVSNALGYNVYREGTRVNSSIVAETAYTDSGLSPGTTYSYTVRAATASGAESPPSNEVSEQTEGNPPEVPTPTNLTVGKVTATSVALSWAAASNVVGYDVYRSTSSDGPSTKVNTNLITDTSYTVGGLTPSTTYFFTVKSENSSGATSGDSNKVEVTTSATTACFTTSNFAHVRAGRAHDSLGFALANGSNANMGLNNVFLITTLKETGPNFYVIDSLTCP